MVRLLHFLGRTVLSTAFVILLAVVVFVVGIVVGIVVYGCFA